MKTLLRAIVPILMVIGSVAHADTCENNLVGTGIDSIQAEQICQTTFTTLTIGATLTAEQLTSTDDATITDEITADAYLPDADAGATIGASGNVFSDIYFGDGTNDCHLDEDRLTVPTEFTISTGEADGSDDSTLLLCGGGGAAATCNTEGRGAWIAIQGADEGGAGVGGAINIEGGATDATGDITIATNIDAADILLRGGTTQATRVTVEGDTGTMTLATGDLVVSAGDSILSAGRTIEVLTVTDNDAQDNTLSAAEWVGGVTVHTSTTGGGTVTTDTAVNLVAGSGGYGALTANNQCIKHYYINDGDQTLTFAGGTDVTVADTGSTILTNEAATLLLCRNTATTATLYVLH